MQKTKVINGNAYDVAEDLPADWFHVILCSPPYWMLRDYGTPPVKWPAMSYQPMAGLEYIKVPAWKGELGQEPTLHMYLAHLVNIFARLYTNLRHDGTLYVNLGDSYLCSGKTSGISTSTLQGRKQDTIMPRRLKKVDQSIPNKNKIGIPHRFALAMQAAGWYWRDEIIWYKPSAMPSSQKDRTSVAHEVILMFSKEKQYFYDLHAMQEPVSGGAHSRGSAKTPQADDADLGNKNNGSFEAATKDQPTTRNPRSVWTINAEPSKEKHFACWPTRLVRKILLASTSSGGCCSQCGKAMVKKLARKRIPTRNGWKSKVGGWADNGSHSAIDWVERRKNGAGFDKDSPYQGHAGSVVGNRDPQRHVTVLEHVGWEPCSCNAPMVPCRVLDPFGGMATTGLQAERMHLDATCIELKPEYAARAKERLNQFRRREAGELFQG